MKVSKEKEVKQPKQLTKLEKGFRLVALCLLSVAAFAGVMSVITGDEIVKYTIASVVVLFCAKELV